MKSRIDERISLKCEKANCLRFKRHSQQKPQHDEVHNNKFCASATLLHK